VLMYHHVSPSPGLVTVSPQAFRDQMAWLARHGYRTIGCDDLAAFFAGEELPPKSVLITFDDGYLDNWLHAHPVLAEFGLRAALFVVTGWIEEGPVREGGACPDHNACKRAIEDGRADDVMLRWSEVEAMRAAGTFEFHSHTHTHTRWDQRLPAGEERLAAMARELSASRETLERRLGAASRHLCWPQGYYEPDYLPLAQRCGFDLLYTTEKRINTRGASPLRIGRVVTKERPGAWLGRRLAIYSRPFWGELYLRLRGGAGA
ncbi:MAG: polysaccharide deacetylase family protein, partial [Ignavibacteria bacterium]